MTKITKLSDLVLAADIEQVPMATNGVNYVSFRRRFHWQRIPKPSELILVNAEWFPVMVPASQEGTLTYTDPLFTLKAIPHSFDCDYFSILCSRCDVPKFYRFLALFRWQLIKLNRKALLLAWMFDFLPTEDYEVLSWKNLSIPFIWHKTRKEETPYSPYPVDYDQWQSQQQQTQQPRQFIQYNYGDMSMSFEVRQEQKRLDNCQRCKYFVGEHGINCGVHPYGWLDQENQCPDRDFK
ncbi:MAG TPA: hypothetical protein VIQ31_32295 [Phormidium sp.]